MPTQSGGFGRRRGRILKLALWLGAVGALLVPTLHQGLAQPATSTEPSTPSTRPAEIASSAFEKAFVVTIQDAISEVTFDSLERRLNEIADQQPQLIIIELDTPGGALGATLDICHRIKRLRDDGVKVYAWVNAEAYSAGTIIALATDGIVMARNATIGDCQPIMMVPGGGASAVPEDIEAKATSPLIEELEDSVRRNGYDYDMVLALIRPDVEIFWVENTETGEQRFVTTEERDQLFGWEDDEGNLLSNVFGGGREADESQTEWAYVEQAPELGEIRQPIVEKDRTLLTMRTAKAQAFGFCQAVVDNESDLKSYFNVSGPLVRLENNWIEDTIEWLASPMVRAIMLLFMLLGAYVEFHTPGFGLGGSVALVLLILFLGAPYMAGYTVTWEIVCIFLGVILLAVEAFVIPGFGVAGILGIVLLVVGLVGSFVPAEPTLPGFDRGFWQLPTMEQTYRYLRHGLYSMAGGLIGAVVGMVLMAKYLPRVPVAGRIVAPNPEHDALQIDDPYQGVAAVGDIGRAESLLRPAGKARFGSTLVDVVSEGEYIEKGIRVEVVQRHGNRVVVRRVD